MADTIRTITVPATPGPEQVGGVLVLPIPKRLAKRVTRIHVWPDGTVCVYAEERLDEATLKWGDAEVPLTWNDAREPARAEGAVDLAIVQEARNLCSSSGG